MTPATRLARWLLARADIIFVVALATWLVWPAPLRMPVSQDHPIHLARAYLVGQALADGHIASWSSAWYFGFPVGELYPVLADLVVVALRAASLTLLPWTTCYAIAFWIGYMTIGLAMVGFARGSGLGRWTGVVAAALCLLDPGTGREGGWRFTVFFGVWMHPLAVALAWWGFGLLAAAIRAVETEARALVRAMGLFALALLAHPGALPMIAVCMLIVVLCTAGGGRLVRASVFAALAGCGAAMLAAWWYAPMLAHRAWMAHFGTLWLELDELVGWVANGYWAKEMPIAVGWAISLGLLFAMVRGPVIARFVAIASLVMWLLASADAFARLRLDLLSDGFRYLQYQRFVICAKPGMFLCAAWVVVSAAKRARARLARASGGWPRAVALALAATCCTWIAWIVHGTANGIRAGAVGEIQRSRAGDDDLAFEHEWRAYSAWAREQWSARDEFWRFAYEAKSRHGHGFGDAPAHTDAPAYKIGFTPGDNFIHRIESDDELVLDRLRVRYVVALDGRRGDPVAAFGRIRVLERPLVEEVARLEGAGELTVVDDDPDGEGVVVDVRGSEGGRIVWNVAGYPRWELRRDGVVVPWYEVPVLGSAASVTPDERRAKEVPARHGDQASPRDPVLLAADAADGRWQLRYRHFTRPDLVGWFCTITMIGMLAWARRRALVSTRLLNAALMRVPAWLVLLGFALVAIPALVRWRDGVQREAVLASGWFRAGAHTSASGVRPGPLMVNHQIGGSIRIEARPDEDIELVLPGVAAGGRAIEGWFAIDDPELRLFEGQAELVVSARGTDAQWTELSRTRLRRRPGRQPITVELPTADLVDLRIQIDSNGKLPRAGFDFDLGTPR
ncbi:MAG TPA: hypothetical protein VG755_17030 [Nannocystaceae bacterium]|nr:hypothetical protein [Nannocystaceae bacterium]